MDSVQFLTETVTPVLKQMDMWSSAAEKLLIMTACHESGGFQYRKQINGPALSYFQMEPATFDDLWNRYLVEVRPERKPLVEQFLPDGEQDEAFLLDQLENNDAFACSMARIKYATVPDALPPVADSTGLSEYCKDHWNTALGAATAEKYLNDFILYGPDPEPASWR